MNHGGAFVPPPLLINPLSKEPDSATGLPGTLELPVLCWEELVGTWYHVLLLRSWTFKQAPISLLKTLHLPQAYGLVVIVPIGSLSYHPAGQLD